MATGFTPTFSGAGTGHRAGAVPDPGQTTPIDYVLRADATWGPGPAGAQQFSIQPMTITATNASTALPFIFDPTYAAPPSVICSSSNPEVMASAYGVTSGGFIGQMTAATPVVVDTDATFSYLAM